MGVTGPRGTRSSWWSERRDLAEDLEPTLRRRWSGEPVAHEAVHGAHQPAALTHADPQAERTGQLGGPDLGRRAGVHSAGIRRSSRVEVGRRLRTSTARRRDR
jgi:hypothetical protein